MKILDEIYTLFSDGGESENMLLLMKECHDVILKEIEAGTYDWTFYLPFYNGVIKVLRTNYGEDFNSYYVYNYRHALNIGNCNKKET